MRSSDSGLAETRKDAITTSDKKQHEIKIEQPIVVAVNPNSDSQILSLHVYSCSRSSL